MQTNPTPAVNCQYGAPMGRKSDHLSGLVIMDNDPPFTLLLTLQFAVLAVAMFTPWED
jgi:hypothetical protein